MSQQLSGVIPLLAVSIPQDPLLLQDSITIPQVCGCSSDDLMDSTHHPTREPHADRF